MRTILTTLIAVTFLWIPAQSQVKPDNVIRATSNDSCPTPKQEFFYSLCNVIATKEEIKDEDSPYEYFFEKIMEGGACVDRSKDSEAQRNEKIRRMWTMYNDRFTCDGGDFGVANGYMLKYAVKQYFEPILKLAVRKWKVPLDRVDSFDGRTTLDYIQDEYKLSRGGPYEADLMRYYFILHDAGATHKKHKSIFITDK